MSVLSNPFVISKWPSLHLSAGDQCLGSTHVAFGFKGTGKSVSQRKALVVQASYSDGGRPSSGSTFVSGFILGGFSGFILGGLIVGTLGCVYAPQISKALTGTDKKDLMNKLPKFIYDEEKILENQRKKLAEKIEQLNSAIDNVSTQLNSEEPLTEATASADNIEAVV